MSRPPPTAPAASPVVAAPAADRPAAAPSDPSSPPAPTAAATDPSGLGGSGAAGGDAADPDAIEVAEDAILDHLHERWDVIIRDCLVDGRPVLAGALADRSPVREADGALLLELRLSGPELERHLPFLHKRLARELPADTGLHVRSQADEHQAAGERRQAYQAAESHPLVRYLRRQLHAEVVSRERIGHDAWLQAFKDQD